MKILSLSAICLIGMALQSSPAMAIKIDMNGNVSGASALSKEGMHHLPGTYYFRKGCAAWKDGNARDAIYLWKIAASWGQKSAQYNLGIAYYTGEGVKKDTVLGLAWLGLAAERHHSLFQDSLDIAWYQSSVEERTASQKKFAELKPRYGDDVALKRALRRYESVARDMTGSRIGATGHLKTYTAFNTRGQNSMEFQNEMQRDADEYFAPGEGRVSVGDLIPFESEPAPPTKSEQ